MTLAALFHPSIPPKAVEPFRDISPNVEIVADLDHAKENISAALIFGGDGTVHRHLPQLHQRKIPALIVPKGSGNDFAKSLGIADERAALAAWKQFCTRGDNLQDIDLGVVRPAGQEKASQEKAGQEVLFCCVASIGLDSEANRIANAMPAWLRGSAGYVLAALRAIARFEPTEFRVQADAGQLAQRHDERREDAQLDIAESQTAQRQATQPQIARPGLFLAVGNAGRYGRGAKVAPKAQLDDGLLDVCFVGKMTKLKTLVCFPTIFLGQHLRLREVEYFQARTVRVETGRPLEVYADGEPVCQTPVEISLLPRALKVIVPA
jgi:diacylglycerol kinase (ATP)